MGVARKFLCEIIYCAENVEKCNNFQQPSFTPPVRVPEGEVRYSIEIDVGGSKGSILQTRILKKILAENGPHV